MKIKDSKAKSRIDLILGSYFQGISCSYLLFVIVFFYRLDFPFFSSNQTFKMPLKELAKRSKPFVRITQVTKI